MWLLAATLTAAFTWKVGAALPIAFAVVAWALAAATVLGGFFGSRGENENGNFRFSEIVFEILPVFKAKR